MSIAAPAQAHNGKVEAIVRAEYLAVAFRGRTESHARGPCRNRIQEFTPCNHFVLSSNPQYTDVAEWTKTNHRKQEGIEGWHAALVSRLPGICYAAGIF